MPIDDSWFENERLHRAAADGNLKEIRSLLATGYRLDVFDDLGRTPLNDLLIEQRRYLDVEAGYTSVLQRAWGTRVALRRARGEIR